MILCEGLRMETFERRWPHRQNIWPRCERPSHSKSDVVVPSACQRSEHVRQCKRCIGTPGRERYSVSFGDCSGHLAGMWTAQLSCSLLIHQVPNILKSTSHPLDWIFGDFHSFRRLVAVFTKLWPYLKVATNLLLGERKLSKRCVLFLDTNAWLVVHAHETMRRSNPSCACMPPPTIPSGP